MPPATASWRDIRRAAVDTLDSHVIKLVFTCEREYENTGHAIYRTIAQHMAMGTYRFEARYRGHAA